MKPIGRSAPAAARAAAPRMTLRRLPWLLAAAGVFSLPAFAQTATTLPTGGIVAAGGAAISQSGAAMRIDQSTSKTVIDWHSFNIGRDASVRFNQPSASAIALNRVGADGGRSLIDGSLSANGQVWLLNPGGALFGPSSRVDVAGLLATTLKLGNDDFMRGDYRFTGSGAGSIVNQGTLTAADGGYIALMAPEVRNEGVIAARLGTVALASGDELRVDFSGDRLIEIKVDRAAVNGLIDNRKLIEAEGGWVLMSAGAASDLAAGAISNAGVVRASSLTEHEGVIRLEAGFAALGGTINADGTNATNGGTIQVATGRGLSLADSVSARSPDGTGGSVSYRSGGSFIETSTSHTDVSGGKDGGSIRVVADGGILSSGSYSATGAAGQGGRLDLSGGSVRLLSALLDASGAAQGGLVRVGGPFQGGKTQDSASDNFQRYSGRFGPLADLPSAQRTFINDSSRIDVSAKDGAGGTAIVWSDQQTTFLGGIRASGATGGAVEISSALDLRYANLAGLDLGSGRLLLDPKNIVIGDFPAIGAWTFQAILGKGYSGGKNVDEASLEVYDNFGHSVALNAAGDRLAVGASYDGGNGNSTQSSGAVRLFSFADTNFSGGALQATLGKGYTGGKNVDVSSLEMGDQFGVSVALNAAGDRLAVGAPGDAGFGNSAPSSGALRLFSFTDASFSGGALQATLGKGYTGGKDIDVSGIEASDYFGRAVALSATGDRLAVGAPFEAGSGNTTPSSGAVRLFSFADTNFTGGSLQATLGKGYVGGKNVDVSSLEANDLFGVSVALNAAGDRLAVGASGDFGSGNLVQNSGAVYLYSFADTSFSGGALQATLGKDYTGGKNVDVSSLILGNMFGSSVALNAAGDRLAVGALGDSGSAGSATFAGAVRLLGFSDTNFSGGTLQATLGKGYAGANDVDVSPLESGDRFGVSVALNASGDRLAVGAAGDRGSGNTAMELGAAYLFSHSTQPPAYVDFFFTPSANQNIDRTGLQALLSTGSSVTLQANNDITLNSGTAIVVNNPVGNGGNLTLQAGRNIDFNASVTTANANLTAIAGDPGAISGSIDPGTPTLTIASGVNLNVGAGTATLAAIGGNVANNNGSSAISTSGAGRWLIYASEPATTTEGFSSYNKHYNEAYLPGLTPSYAGSGNWFFYTLAPMLDVAATPQTVTYGGAIPGLTPSYRGFVDGDTSPGTTTGAATWSVAGSTSTAGFPVAGSHDVNYAGGLANSSLGYGFRNDTAALNELTIAPRSLAVTGLSASSKVYDAATQASVTLSGTSNIAPLGGDLVTLSGTPSSATFSDKNVGTAKTVTVSGLSISGADAGNYALVASTTADITPKALGYTGTVVNKAYDGTTTATVSSQSLSGVISGDAVSVSAGSANFEDKEVGTGKPVMIGGIALSGADAGNYFAPPHGFAEADITPATSIPSTSNSSIVTGATTVAQESSAPSTQVAVDPSASASAIQPAGGSGSGGATMSNFPASSAPAPTTQSASTPVTTASATPEAPPPPPKLIVDASKSMPRLAGVLNRADLQALSQQVHEARTQLFAGALALLANDPRAADVADCDAGGGEVCIAKSKVKIEVEEGYAPVVKRKIALLIGNNAYLSPIPSLQTAINDVTAIGTVLRDKLDYEVKVVENAGRKEIVEALNGLILSAERNDSVLVMYAGHGYLQENTQTGYWIPSDGSTNLPDRWISNDTISRALGNIPAKQVMLVSDSCYSGSLTKEGKVTEVVGVGREQMLTRRSVLAMSSGGEEPVSDEGHDNHSIFAWNMIRSLSQMKEETSGQRLHAHIKEAVTKEFPQVPQYGALVSAGHKEGGEYLLTPKN